MKKTWSGIVAVIRMHMRHEWSPDNRRFLGVSYQVRMVVRVQGGREDDRDIEVWMTPDDAEAHARAILEAAKEARTAQENL